MFKLTFYKVVDVEAVEVKLKNYPMPQPQCRSGVEDSRSSNRHGKILFLFISLRVSRCPRFITQIWIFASILEPLVLPMIGKCQVGLLASDQRNHLVCTRHLCIPRRVASDRYRYLVYCMCSTEDWLASVRDSRSLQGASSVYLPTVT